MHTPATQLHVTTYEGNGAYQYERVVTTVYALTYEYLDALESLLRGAEVAPEFVAEFERIGVLKSGVFTALGCEVVRAAGLELTALTYDEAEFALAPELTEPLEIISAGDLVYIERDYGRKSFYAVVEVIDVMTRKALVWHASGGWFAGEWDVQALKLIEKAAQGGYDGEVI